MSRSSSLFLCLLTFLLTSQPVDAALTTGGCLAMKRQAWGNLRKCESTEHAKALRGKTADVAKCSSKFQEKLAQITAKATKGAIACRYADNGDGTVIDFDMGLQWEQKTSSPISTEHFFENEFSWGISTNPDGDAFTLVLGRLNSCQFAPGFFNPVPFAGFCDWRLPTLPELNSILLAPSPCGTSPCVDPIFGPTNTDSPYWTNTTNTGSPGQAWTVSFVDGSWASVLKSQFRAVRAVRNAF